MEKYRKLKYSDFDDFKNKPFNMGILTLNLTSWDEFHSVRYLAITQIISGEDNDATVKNGH